MKWPVSFRGTGKTSIWGNSLFLKEGPGQVPRGLRRDRRGELLPVGAERRRPQRRRVRRRVHRVRHELSVALHGQLGEAQRPRPALRRRRVRARDRAAPGRRCDAVVRARRLGQGQGASRTRRARPGRVAVWGARGTRSAAIFDLDGDGDLDIVTNEFNTAPMVLVSNLTEKTRVRYLEVKLTGTTSNRDGLGAVVKVTAGGSTYTKVMDGNSGYLSHSLYPLYFGLGAAETVDASRCCGRPGRSRPSARRSRSIRGSRCASSGAFVSPATGVRLRLEGREAARGRYPTLLYSRRLRHELRIEARDPADRSVFSLRRSSRADR